jgi:hypothetical protein
MGSHRARVQEGSRGSKNVRIARHIASGPVGLARVLYTAETSFSFDIPEEMYDDLDIEEISFSSFFLLFDTRRRRDQSHCLG